MREVVDRWRVCWHLAMQRWCLHDRLTGDAEVLPPASGPWSLCGSPDGKAFVSVAGSSPLWCMDLLRHTVVQRPGTDDAAVVVETDSGDLRPLEQFKAEHAILETPIHIAGSCKPVALVCYLLRMPWDGARVFWNLKVLHKQVQGATKLTPSQWYQSWWPWWKKRCIRAGLPDSHIRRANKTNHSEEEVPGPWNLKLRCFEDTSVSSPTWRSCGRRGAILWRPTRRMVMQPWLGDRPLMASCRSSPPPPHTRRLRVGLVR